MTSKTYLRSLDYVRKILLLDFIPIGAGWFFGAETNLGMFFLWTSGIILLVLCGSLVVLSIVSKPLTIVSVTPLPRIDPELMKKIEDQSRNAPSCAIVPTEEDVRQAIRDLPRLGENLRDSTDPTNVNTPQSK